MSFAFSDGELMSLYQPSVSDDPPPSAFEGYAHLDSCLGDTTEDSRPLSEAELEAYLVECGSFPLTPLNTIDFSSISFYIDFIMAPRPKPKPRESDSSQESSSGSLPEDDSKKPRAIIESGPHKWPVSCSACRWVHAQCCYTPGTWGQTKRACDRCSDRHLRGCNGGSSLLGLTSMTL